MAAATTDGRFAGTVALVTGAGRREGIGRACALLLAQEGADVIVHGSRREPNEEERELGWKGAHSVAEEIRAIDRRSAAIELDLADRGGAGELVERAGEEFGPIGVLVNNAGSGAGTGGGDIVELDDDDWYVGVDVNLHAIYAGSKAVIPQMRQRGGGAIVNVSSLAGLRARPNYGSYSATKFAIVGFTQQLALEQGPDIRVNCVCPGVTRTDMLAATFARKEVELGMENGELYEKVAEAIPLARFAKPEEMAQVVAFLASPTASYVTGQSIAVDGGLDLVSPS